MSATASAGTQSPKQEQVDPMGETGKSKPMSDGEQRSEQFKEGKGDSKIESGSATDIGKVAEEASATADAYNKKTNMG